MHTLSPGAIVDGRPRTAGVPPADAHASRVRCAGGTPARQPPGRRRSAADAAIAFVAEAASARPLAAMRIGVALVLLLQALAIAPHVADFFGPRGIVQAMLVDAMVAPELPRVSWLTRALAPLGLGETAALAICFGAYVASLHFLLLGWHTRIAAAAAWLLHLTLKTSGNLSAYGVFEFATIALFYCVCFPAGDAWSVDARRRPCGPSAEARLGTRVVQLHLCIVYLASGIEKASGEQWRNGEAIWRAVMRPSFEPVDLSWLATHWWIALLAAWGTLFIELGYAFLVWPRRTRRAFVLATIGMHAGIAVLLGLWAFSGMMIALNAAAFLVTEKQNESIPAH